MKIDLPISNFKLKGNKLYLNKNIIEYEAIPKYKKQLIEKLISRNAFGSALFVLNNYVNVVKINESRVNLIEYKSYLEECNKLMRENTVELKEAQVDRPFFNLKGIKMFESKEGIIKEINNKLYLEKFNQVRKTLPKRHFIKEEAEGTQCSDIAEKKDQEVGSLQRPKKTKKVIVKEEKKPFTPNEVSKYVDSFNSKTGSHKHTEDFTWLYMAGNVDGMKIKGVSGTQIFDINSGEYLGDYNRWIKEEN